jgi:hypothetical protein
VASSVEAGEVRFTTAALLHLGAFSRREAQRRAEESPPVGKLETWLSGPGEPDHDAALFTVKGWIVAVDVESERPHAIVLTEELRLVTFRYFTGSFGESVPIGCPRLTLQPREVDAGVWEYALPESDPEVVGQGLEAILESGRSISLPADSVRS